MKVTNNMSLDYQTSTETSALTLMSAIKPCDALHTSREPRRSGFDFISWVNENILKPHRFPSRTRHDKRLKEALTLSDNIHLLKATVLCRATHKRHAINLHKRFRNKFGKNLIALGAVKRINSKVGEPISGYYEPLDHQNARKLISFVSVIHAVEALDVDVALKSADELQKQVKDRISMMPGAACIGALEVEMTSIKLMRRIRDFDYSRIALGNLLPDEDGVIASDGTFKEYRKLDDCEILGSHLSHEEINGESGQFIVHFHGLIKVQKPEDLIGLNRLFLDTPSWNRASRQVLFTPFSKTWGDKHKSIEDSLSDFSKYFTKGGAVMEWNKGFLKYNIELPKEMPMSYDEYLTFNDQSNDARRQELVCQGYILDLPYLSNHEISSLFLVNYRLMNRNKSGTGYIVSVGKW